MTNSPASPSQPASKPSRPLAKISLKWSMIEEDGLSILEKFQLLRDLGFDGVELDSPGDLPSREVLDARDKTGVAIPGLVNSMHWKSPLTDADPAVRQACVASMITALNDAKLYGADTVLLVPGVVRNSPTTYKTAYSRALEEIAKITPYAEETGVSIALENVWNDFLLSPLEAAGFVDACNHPKVGWYFDVGNVLRYGRPVDWIEALGTRILKIDVKEYSLDKMNSEGPWKGFEVEIGDGDCDWPAVNRALSEIGYSGWASVEVPGGDRHRLAAIKERVDRIAAARTTLSN
ncbi:sugar phosphate isomerase/epimerase family protein [Rhizobium sp. S163]|uniref:sugar phosphate isomerase/epimerase family protein n=1 Tax=Rhizobium sp. S163 TaxID=3055039 RepID=UPI0025A95A28|nr:sugar phosphate isomerase/epimerase family protein [Rhizobium sp. S163]